MNVKDPSSTDEGREEGRETRDGRFGQEETDTTKEGSSQWWRSFGKPGEVSPGRSQGVTLATVATVKGGRGDRSGTRDWNESQGSSMVGGWSKPVGTRIKDVGVLMDGITTRVPSRSPS